MIWILIFYVGSNAPVTFTEFTSERNCAAAKAKFDAGAGRLGPITVCAQK